MSVVDSFLGKLQRITYKQPRQMYGSEALHVLNKLLDNGVNLRGGKQDLGFLFLYELLTGAFFLIFRKEARACLLGVANVLHGYEECSAGRA